MMIRSALIAAAFGIAGIAPSMLGPGTGPLPDPRPPVVATNTTTNSVVPVTAQRVQVVVQAFDGTGRAVPFVGTVTIADRSSFITAPVRLSTLPSLLDLRLVSTGFQSFLRTGIE